MRLDKKLNLVIPIEDDERTIYVHSMPISKQVFEANVFIISKTLSVLYEEGLTVFAQHAERFRDDEYVRLKHLL